MSRILRGHKVKFRRNAFSSFVPYENVLGNTVIRRYDYLVIHKIQKEKL